MIEVTNIFITIYTISLHIFFFITILRKKTKYRKAKAYILVSITMLIFSLVSLWGMYYLVGAEHVKTDVKMAVVQIMVTLLNFMLLANLVKANEIAKN
jgi:heme/copper-type cytochrome/quinol oxidase subunit 4